ncbi:hypothetical protein [Streptomyces sp. NPDC002644]
MKNLPSPENPFRKFEIGRKHVVVTVAISDGVARFLTQVAANLLALGLIVMIVMIGCMMFFGLIPGIP